MTSNSNGEVFGVKALNLAIIGASVAIMLGVLWQPAPAHVTTNKAATQVEQVAKAPVSPGVAG